MSQKRSRSAATSPQPQGETPAASILSAADRENPSKLSGADLRHLAWQKGLAKSSLPSMSDDKIREQLRYITQNQYEGS